MSNKNVNFATTSESAVLSGMSGKYDLVFYASQRARAILSGARPECNTILNATDGGYSVIAALEEMRNKSFTMEDVLESLAFGSGVPTINHIASEQIIRDSDDEDEESTSIDYKNEEEDYED